MFTDLSHEPNLTYQSDGNHSEVVVSASPSLAGQASPVTEQEYYTGVNALPGSESSALDDYSQNLGNSMTIVVPSLDVTTVTVIELLTPSAISYAPNLPPPVASSSSSAKASDTIVDGLLTPSARYPSSLLQSKTFVPSQAPYPYKNATRTSSIRTSTITPIARGQCSGCALAALNPITTSYHSNIFGNWTSLVVTETILTEFITYLDNSTIDTIVTETKTVNQTKTVDGWITDTAAEFNIYLPTPGLDLTLDVGPTYVIYTSLYGGPDVQVEATGRNNATQGRLRPTQSICQPHVSSLTGWIPSQTQDWNYFIQTYANGSLPESTAVDSPIPVPTKLQSYLAQDRDLQIYFQGADIATCSLARLSDMLIGNPNISFKSRPPTATSTLLGDLPQPTRTMTTRPAFTFSPPAFSSVPGTNTYLSTTYASTSKHITKQGCLRCDTNRGDRPQTPAPPDVDTNTNNFNDNPTPTNRPNTDNGKSPESENRPQDPIKNTQPSAPGPEAKTTPSIPNFISSVVSDNPDLTRKPQPTDSGQTVTIGDKVVTVKPQPTIQGPEGSGQKSNVPTMVIIGTQTVTVGQTRTINGVPVVVPSAGRGSTIVVGDKTIDINPRITQAPMPILTVGQNTITANSQGQLVVGTQTLQRGGPVMVLDGNTLTLGPNGRIAIWNSDSATLATMVDQPAVTFGGQQITAKVLGGTTVFVLGDKTLGPSSAVTVDGTTFSLPPGFHGSSIVINGQTQRLSPGLPVLTVDNSAITANVVDGKTGFVLAPGQILTPGGELVINGKTYSLPTEGQGSTIVVNGVTSTLNPSHLPVLPLNSEEVTATVAHGTTAFVFGPGQTLTPGGVITVSGTTISLPASASGSVVVINGVTSTLGPGSNFGFITSAPPIVVDGRTLTATVRDGTTEYVLNSATTLLPGGQVIIDGTTYSLAPGGTAVVINGKTSLLSPASNSASATTSERGAGDFIASGIGESSRSRGAENWAHGGGADKWAENLMMGLAGWLLWLI